MTHPPGVSYKAFNGQSRLATEGPRVGSEPVVGSWRAWDVSRSKLGALIDRDIDTGLTDSSRVLYLGAATGTTVSHIADFAGPVYAVEFAPEPARKLIETARDRANLFPLIKDARDPDSYSHVVEANIDTLVQDIATRGQANVAIQNRRFLADNGRLILMIKARSEDVTADPNTVFKEVIDELTESYEIVRKESLEPLHTDHLAVIARPRL